MPLSTSIGTKTSVGSLTAISKPRTIVSRGTIVPVGIYIIVIPIVSRIKTMHNCRTSGRAVVISTMVGAKEVLAAPETLTGIPEVKDVTTGSSMI